MWFSTLFWKLFLAYAILSTISACGIAITMSRWLEPRVSRTQEVAEQSELPELPRNRLKLATINRLFWTSAIVSCSLSLVVTLWIVAPIARSVTTLTQAAESVAKGDYKSPVYVSNRDEIGQLARSFNRMRVEMDSREGQLRDTNQRLSTVLGGMTDGVIAVNNQEQVLFANAAAGRLMGFAPAEAQGRSLLEVVRHHTLREAVLELQVAPGQRHLELELGEASDDLTLAVNATSLPDHAGVVLVFTNLTERRRLEAMRRDFVANVSHELKTPLSSINAYAETLLNGAIDDPAHRGEFVAQIAEQADRLQELILDLLSLARIESGQQALDLGPVLVAHVVDSCLKDCAHAADAKRIEFALDGQNPQAAVRAEDAGLRQILSNLIDNAIKYTPEGGRVTVRWSVESKAVSISVEDTGIGIPVELQSRVFERFFRVDKARSRELGGTGLGLAIVKHLTQRFGGTVQVESQPHRGSQFTVTLPAA